MKSHVFQGSRRHKEAGDPVLC